MPENKPTSFIIYGGDLENKGAQAMTYITVYEIKKRWPNANVALLSTRDCKRVKNKEKYKFDIQPFTLQTMLYCSGGIYRLASAVIQILKKSKPDNSMETLLEKTDVMINISGYALSSQWGFTGSVSYLLSVLLMKKKKIKVFLFPQSFGPFDYKGVKRLLFRSYAKRALSYPDVIFAREESGMKALKEFGLSNVRRSTDLVLQNSEVDYTLVLNEMESVRDGLAIPEHSVCIVPNVRVAKNMEDGSYVDFYKGIINYLLDKGRQVVLLTHSASDAELCRQIAGAFIINENITYIEDELSCVEYNEIVSRFDYVIAARLHSIVHAYKKDVPCIAVGWATKYQELLELFDQQKYVLDVRNLSVMDSVYVMINDMERNLETNKNLIKCILKDVQKDNCFMVLDSLRS